MTQEFASRIERVMVRPDATAPEIHRAVTEAVQGGFAAIQVAPVWVAKVATMLRGSGVGVVTVIGYPFGGSKATIKAIEASSSIKDGATEVELCPFLPNIISADADALKAELLEINRAARTTNRDVVIRVCINTMAGLRDDQIGSAARAIRESGADCFSIASDVVDEVKRVHAVAEGLSIVAVSRSGDPESIRRLIEAGANRVGVRI